MIEDLRHNYRAFRETVQKDQYIIEKPYVITRMSLAKHEIELDFNFPIDCVLKDLIQIHFYGAKITYIGYPHRVIIVI